MSPRRYALGTWLSAVALPTVALLAVALTACAGGPATRTEPATSARSEPAPRAAEADGATVRLTVEIDGVTVDGGPVRIALSAEADDFTSGRAGVTTASLAADSDHLVWQIEVAPGTYALKAYQDLDGDEALDRGAFGIPTEPWAVSGSTGPRVGAPRFEDAKFALLPEGAEFPDGDDGTARQQLTLR